ncbi:MAG TPA: hypothetical protein VNQ90_09755 [Chthoniobacteraceae bacterium]|nr:hypothetical protein [Chthoniobacteraceae bacterium]
MTAVKFRLLFLFLIVAGVSGCSSLATRDDLYSPEAQEGPYTKMFREHRH